MHIENKDGLLKMDREAIETVRDALIGAMLDDCRDPLTYCRAIVTLDDMLREDRHEA